MIARLVKQVIMGVFSIAFLSACLASSQGTPVMALTNEKIDMEGLHWMEEAATKDGIVLNPRGIRALDRNLVFLFGGFSTTPGTIRSVLLRSDDGGEHWQEVMQPERGSDVRELVFTEDGHGWALVLWTVEGPGPAYLYHTADWGENWQKLSEIPLYDHGPHSYPLGLQFTGEQHGSVRIISSNAANAVGISGEVCCLYETTDAGITWNETKSCFTIDDCRFKESTEFIAEDSGEWGVESQPDATLQISHRLSSEGVWDVVSSIPARFEYLDGKIVIP